jgi:hypothetical protein
MMQRPGVTTRVARVAAPAPTSPQLRGILRAGRGGERASLRRTPVSRLTTCD